MRFPALPALLSIFTAAIAYPAQAQHKSFDFATADTMAEIQSKIEANNFKFNVEGNWVTRLTPEERRIMTPARWGLPPGQRPLLRGEPVASGMARLELPAKFDWRSQNGKSYVGPVRDQGVCGSCYAFGACAAAESAYNIAKGLTGDACSDFSETYIAFCLGSLSDYSKHFYGCEGSDYEYSELTASSATGYYSQYDGMATEADCPYKTSGVDTAQFLGKVATHKMNTWKRIFPANYEETTDQMKAAVSLYGVIVVAIQTTSAFDAYKSGVYQDNNTTPSANPYYYQESDHVVAVVGWDDNPPEGGGGCWIVRNSWGKDWGEDGYIRMRYKSAAINCAAAYFAYDAPKPVSLAVLASPADAGTTSPAGTSTITTGVDFAVIASANPDYAFSSWSLTGGGYVQSPVSASTTARLTSDSTLTANFARQTSLSVTVATSPVDYGSTNPSGVVQVVPGATVSVSAIPASGRIFSRWTLAGAGAVADAASASTAASFTANSILTAEFAAAPTIGIGKLSLSLDNTKPNGDSISISKAEYPSTAPTSPAQAVLTLDGVPLPACDSANGTWKTSYAGMKHTYTSTSSKPKIKMEIDLSKSLWSCTATGVSLNQGVNVSDGLSLRLDVNGATAGVRSLPYNDCNVKSKLDFSE